MDEDFRAAVLMTGAGADSRRNGRAADLPAESFCGRRVLVTGAGGFTGRHAAALFASLGAEVTAVLRRPETEGARAQPLPKEADVVVCDLQSRQGVRGLLEAVRPDYILHLAGRNSVPESWRDPAGYMESNVMAAAYLLEALDTRPEARLLVAGSRLKFRPEAGEGPPHPYSLSKTLEEWICLAWGDLFRRRVWVAEPCNLIGPGPSTGFCSLLAGHIARCEAEGGQPAFVVSARGARRDFLDVRDAVAAYAYILSDGQPGAVYRIDSGAPRTLGEIAEGLLELTEAEVPMAYGPEDGAPDPGLPGGALPASVPSAPAERGAPGQGKDRFGRPAPAIGAAAASVQASPAVAGAGAADLGFAGHPAAHAADLGWRARVPLEDSLADILQYQRQYGQRHNGEGAQP